MTQQATAANTKANGGAAHAGGADDGFLDFETDIPSFKPEMYREIDKKNAKRENYIGKPVQGYVLAHELVKVQDPQTGDWKDQSLYTILLTKPSNGTLGDEQVEVPAGKPLKVWGNAQLKQFIKPAVANHPSGMVEVRITPLYREPLPKSDRKMWFFKLQAKPPVARKSVGLSGNAVMARLESTAPKQLLASGGGGGGAQSAIDVDGQEISF